MISTSRRQSFFLSFLMLLDLSASEAAHRGLGPTSDRFARGNAPSAAWLSRQITVDPDIGSTLDEVLLSLEVQTGIAFDVCPALSGSLLTACIRSRPISEVIRGISRLYGCNTRIVGTQSGLRVYFWYAPHQLAAACELRKKVQSSFDEPLLRDFQRIIHSSESEVADAITQGMYSPYTYGAAVFMSMYDQEQQSEILKNGLDPIPYRHLPQNVQDGLKKAFERALRKFGEDLRPLSGEPQYVDPSLWMPFLKFGFAVTGVGNNLTLRITMDELSGGDPGYPVELERPRVMTGGALAVGWTRWTYEEARQGGGRPNQTTMIGATVIAESTVDQALNESAVGILDELRPGQAVRSRSTIPDHIVYLYRIADAMNFDVLIDRSPIVPGSEIQFPFLRTAPRDMRELLDGISTATGYSYGYESPFLLWRSSDWFGFSNPGLQARAPGFLLVPRRLTTRWDAMRKMGDLSIAALAHMASCSDDQLKSREMQSFPERKVLKNPLARNVLVFFDTLSPEEQSRAVSGSGVSLGAVDTSQLRLLRLDAAPMVEVWRAIANRRNHARLWVRDYPNPKRKIMFKFVLPGGQASKVWVAM